MSIKEFLNLHLIKPTSASFALWFGLHQLDFGSSFHTASPMFLLYKVILHTVDKMNPHVGENNNVHL